MSWVFCRLCGAHVRDDDLLHFLSCQGVREAEVAPAHVAPAADPDAHRRARRTDPETSHAAAAPDRVRDRDRAYAALRAASLGLTDFELADAIGRQQTSAGKRRGELRDAGLVVDSGLRRSAPSGSAAIVWRAKRPDE